MNLERSLTHLFATFYTSKQLHISTFVYTIMHMNICIYYIYIDNDSLTLS